ncbi:MAG TPA: glycosyltransferase family 2 protein [Chthoniobacterales bacterium]
MSASPSRSGDALLPRVAVVIPLFNHAPYIRAALESVLGQTNPPDRIIVVDDGSTDGSPDVVDRLRFPKVELFRQENQGAHMALNRGIALANDCEWIAILNSDDIYHPERLAKCFILLQQRPQTALITTGLHLIDDDGQPLDETSSKVRRLRAIWDLVRADANPLLSLAISNFTKTTSNFVVRRQFLLDHPFGAYRYVHDYHTALQAAFEGVLTVLPEDLLGYRTHETNTIKSSGKSPVIMETLRMNLDLLSAWAPKLRSSQRLRKRYRQYFQRLLGNHTDFRGELFFQLIAQLLASNPQILDLKTLADFPELKTSPEALPARSTAPMRLVDPKIRGLKRVLKLIR